MTRGSHSRDRDRERPGVGVGVLVRRGDDLLLVRRRHHGAGEWAAPGGYLDHGEGFEACAAREVREETGVEIAAVRVIGVANDVHPDGKHNVTIWLAARYAGGEAHVADPNESMAVDWFGVDALPSPIYLSTANVLEGRSSPPDAAGSAHPSLKPSRPLVGGSPVADEVVDERATGLPQE